MILRVKLTPKASRNAVVGWTKDADGHPVLKCSVTAVPEKGKANAALIALLAKELKTAKSSITLLRGDTDRHKLLEIDSDEAALKALTNVHD